MSAVLKEMAMSLTDPYYATIGEQRLANWGDWSSEDTARRLGFPPEVPFARLYAPDKGDVYVEAAGDLEAEPVIDDTEAAKVEQVVLALGDDDRYLLYLRYIRKLPVSSNRKGVPTLVRYTQRNEDDVKFALNRLAVAVGQIRL